MSKKGRKFNRLRYEEKKLALKHHFENGVCVEDLAAEVHVHTSTVYSWLKRIDYDFDKIDLLKPPPTSRRTRKSRILTDLPDWVQSEIKSLRAQHARMGPLKMKQYFFRHHQVVVPEKQIYFYLKAQGLICERAKETVSLESPRRFEYPSPLSAVQMDTLQVPLSGGSRIYLVTLLDDYSRFILNSRFIAVKVMDEIIRIFRETVKEHGVMDRLLTDKGSEFVSWSSFTRFETLLCDLDVELIASGPSTPQNQGKLERWHQTFREDCEKKYGGFDYRSEAQFEVNRFVNYYNFERPHQGLGGLVPADRYFGLSEELERELVDYKAGLKPDKRVYICCNIHGQKVVLSGNRTQELKMMINSKEVEFAGK